MPSTANQWSLQDLDSLLGQGEWQAADQVTFALMLAAADRVAEGWLNRAAIAQFPCQMLHQLDQHWLRYSGGHFGFSVQRQIYVEGAERTALTFSQQVGWTALNFRPLAFFKFYDFLNFSLEAPKGHLPALWFWRLPWYESCLRGGFGTGRGAGFGDANLLDAMMLRLERCQML